jgi:hypothetical protein
MRDCAIAHEAQLIRVQIAAELAQFITRLVARRQSARLSRNC